MSAATTRDQQLLSSECNRAFHGHCDGEYYWRVATGERGRRSDERELRTCTCWCHA